MAIDERRLTEIEAEARETFLADRAIELGDDGTIRGEVLQKWCIDEWRAGRNRDLLVRGGCIEGDLGLDYVRCDAALEFERVKLGRLRLRRATLNGLVVRNCDVRRIEAVGLETARSVDLNGAFCAHERVRLVAATIGGDLNCEGAKFGRSPADRERGRSALILDSARISGNLRLRHIRADGWVSAWGVRVGGEVVCSHANFANNQGGSLSLRNADVGLGADLSECTAEGVLDLRDARFGGGVSLDDATVRGDLRLQRCQVGGELTLDRIKVEPWAPDPDDRDAKGRRPSSGSIELQGARIHGARLHGSASIAASLDLTHVTVERSVSLREVTLGGPDLDLSEMRIGGALSVREIRSAGTGSVRVNMQGLDVGELDDGRGSWPEGTGDTHVVDGIRIGSVREPELEWRVAWLRRNAIWSPQPWQAVSAALRRQGHDKEARTVAVHREDERTRRAGLPWWSRYSRPLLRMTVGYGHRPVYALAWAVGIVTLCALLFTQAGFRADEGAPERSVVLYSVDTFLPVDLGYFGSWTPTDVWWNALAVVEAASGWLLAALLVAALTGLLKQD